MPKLFSATGQKRPKERRTQRQKLVDAVTQAHAQLLASSRDRSVPAQYPSAAVEEMFARYSRALRALVGHHLAAPGWEIAVAIDGESSWKWDGYNARFYFDYDGYADLPSALGDVTNGRAPRMCCSTHLLFDPQKPLDDELARLGGEASHYRRCVQEMERSAYAAAQTPGEIKP